nr:hypothetical protein [Tanacetum cinerariifolium]
MRSEYYAIASEAAPPKTKASVRETRSSFDTIMPPPTAAGTRLSTSAKEKQPAKSSKAKGLSVFFEVALTEAGQIKLATKRTLQQTHISQTSRSCTDEKTGNIPGVLDVPTNEEISWKSSDEDNDDDQDSDSDDDDFVYLKLSTHDEEAKDEESFNLIVQTPSQVENSDDEGNDDESHDINVGGDEGMDAKDDDEELYRDVNINLEGRDVKMTDVHTTQVLENTHVTLTLVNPDGQQQSSSVSSQFVMSMFNPSPDTGIDSLFESTHRMDVPVTTTVVPLLVTASTLHPPLIPIISQIRSDKLRDEAQAKNEDFLNKLDENIQKIIKEQVKDQVKVQVSKILPKIKKTVNEQLEAEVLTRSSNSLKTSYAVAVDLSELELNKILLKRWKATNTYGDTFTFKRRRDDEDKDKEPSAGSDRGSKRRREGKEPESTSAPKEKASKTSGKSTEGSKSYQKTVSESAPAEEPMQTTQDLEEPSHQEFETGAADD